MDLFPYIFVRYFNAEKNNVAHGQTHTYQEHPIQLRSPSKAVTADSQSFLGRSTASSRQRYNEIIQSAQWSYNF